MKYYIILFALILSVLRSSAQSLDAYTQSIDIFPPPPNATAIIKHSQLNINKNTGAPNINIPLFPLKGYKLQMGVSLNYATTGIKVDEISSRVGMGWSLEAGGVVTRTVRGNQDELNTRTLPPATLGQDCETYTFFKNATDGPLAGDSEPDLFNFSMNGQSGSFVLDQTQQPIILSGQKFLIELNWSATAAWNFKITGADGIVYYFGGAGAVESTLRQQNCGVRNFSAYTPVSWYLIKIQHPDGETINLDYSPITYVYDTGFTETQQWRFLIPNADLDPGQAQLSIQCPECAAVPNTYCITRVSTHGVLLNTITSNTHNSMRFIYDTRTDCTDKILSEVDYLADGVKTGSFSLAHTTVQSDMNFLNQVYTGQDKTPYLTSLGEFSTSGVLVNQHLFSYNNPSSRPPRLSYSQDHWGYFNGVYNTTSFIQRPPTADLQRKFPFATADRNAYEGWADRGMLSKIQYPTGGSDTIIYEANKRLSAPQVPTHILYGQATGSGVHDPITVSYTFTLPTTQTISIQTSCDTNATGFLDTLHNKGLIYINSASSNVYTLSINAKTSRVDALDLGPGTYTLQVQANGAIITTHTQVSFKGTVPGANVNQVVGGVRVKSILTSTAGQPAQVHSYFYGQLASMDLSSLTNVFDPVYYQNTRTGLSCTLVTAGQNMPHTGTCQGIGMYSSSIRNMYDFSGALVSYSSVIESIGGNFEGGGIQSKYYTAADAAGQIIWGQDQPGATKSNFSIFYNGKIKEESILKKTAAGTLIPVKTQIYTYKVDTTGARILSGYVVQKQWDRTVQTVIPCIPNSAIAQQELDPFNALRYDNMTAWVYNDSLFVKTFDKNGLNPVIDTTLYQYTNYVNRQLTNTLTSTSDGRWNSEQRKYPNDYSSTPVYASMIAKNIINPVVDIATYKTSTQLSEAKINYNDWGNGIFALASLQKSYYGGPLTTEGNINAYDKHGNVSQYTGKDQITTAILWGGPHGQFPVAKITGATYATVAANLGVVDTALYTMTESAIRAQIDILRAALPAAQISTYTFKQKVGISSITDPRDNTSSYTYDTKDRLSVISDRDNNIVKKFDYNFGIPTPDNIGGFFGNDYVQGAFTCQTCATGYTAQPINYGIAANTFFAASKAEANAAANIALQQRGQLQANQFSTCTKNQPVYWNAQQSASFTRNNCSVNFTGSTVTYTIPAHTYSGTTQYDADQLAIYNLNQGGQAYANTNGTCTSNCNGTNCSGVDKKCINGVCSTGVKTYTSSVQQGVHQYLCTYHYAWSDGSVSQDYTETSTTACLVE